jgi:hypothetical protein
MARKKQRQKNRQPDAPQGQGVPVLSGLITTSGDEIIGTVAAPIANQTKPRRKPGHKPTYEWKLEMAAEIVRIVAQAGGKIPDNDAALARELLQICQNRFAGWEPGDNKMREFIAEILGPARNAG